MADDPKPDDDDKSKPDPKPDDALGDAGKKALDAERKARRDAEKHSKDLEQRLQELEDKDKSETDKLRDENAQLRKDLDTATADKLRLEVAAEKGVKPRYISGSTRDELETAADEYLEDHPRDDEGAKPPPTRKPAADLKGGGDPTSDSDTEMDPAKLAESVPRI